MENGIEKTVHIHTRIGVVCAGRTERTELRNIMYCIAWNMSVTVVGRLLGRFVVRSFARSLCLLVYPLFVRFASSMCLTFSLHSSFATLYEPGQTICTRTEQKINERLLMNVKFFVRSAVYGVLAIAASFFSSLCGLFVLNVVCRIEQSTGRPCGCTYGFGYELLQIY